MIEKGKNKTKVRGGKRTSVQREADIHFCIQLYLKGYTIRDIHERLMRNLSERGMDYEISCQQVFNDIKAEMIEWKKENMMLVNEYIELEVRKLDKMEIELWDAWERSKSGKRRSEIKGGNINNGNVSGGTLSKRTLETGDGDPRYLDMILKLYDRKAKLLGYNAPLNVNIYNKPSEEETPGANYDISSLPTEMIVQMAYQLQDAEFNKKKAENENQFAE